MSEKPFTRARILSALNALGEELTRQGVHGQSADCATPRRHLIFFGACTRTANRRSRRNSSSKSFSAPRRHRDYGTGAAFLAAPVMLLDPACGSYHLPVRQPPLLTALASQVRVTSPVVLLVIVNVSLLSEVATIL